jgi:hypothetical protein
MVSIALALAAVGPRARRYFFARAHVWPPSRLCKHMVPRHAIRARELCLIEACDYHYDLTRLAGAWLAAAFPPS